MDRGLPVLPQDFEWPAPSKSGGHTVLSVFRVLKSVFRVRFFVVSFNEGEWDVP